MNEPFDFPILSCTSPSQGYSDTLIRLVGQGTDTKVPFIKKTAHTLTKE